jgi:tRNA pseudouridine55 synthase
LTGIILLNKPTGQTSFQSLGELKRRLGTGRVGHTGTLDKFAEGLLVVLCGTMTRLCAFATEMDKEYVAVVTFGRGTDTLDPEGAVTAEGTVPTAEEIRAVLPSFRGEISQVPPAYSAVHVDGRRAYQAAREGSEVRIAARTVRIDQCEMLDLSGADATLRIACSKGTYIRSLARDIAERLGTCAHVSQLRRTRVGGFRVEDAVAPDAFDPSRHVLSPSAFFGASSGLNRLPLKGEWVKAVGNGMPFSPAFSDAEEVGEGIFGAFSPQGDLVAVLEKSGSAWHYRAVFPPELIA